MTTIAQRRVAGATALMILLYLLQVALFAPPAGAGHAADFASGNPSNECGWEGDGAIPNELYKKYQYSGSFSSPEGSADVTVELSAGGFTYTNNESTLLIYRIILKVGAGVGSDVVLGDHNVEQSDELAIPNGLSHVTFCLTDAPAEDEPVSVSVTARCETGEDGSANGFLNVVIDPATGATVTVDGDSYIESTSNIAVDAPGSYPWTAVAADGFELQGDSSGTATVEDCADIPPPPPPPPPPSTTPTTTTLQSTSVSFDAFCDDDLNFVAAFSLANASGSLDINGDGVFGPGETSLGSGTYVLTGETYTWQATADAGFTLTGITSGSGETEACAEVLGTTITTAPAEVSADTLPFTGFESGEALKLGLLAMLAGVLMLFAVRGPKENEPATVDMGGWSSL